eukprot:237910-Prymnesium_polylepis.1
MKMSQLVKTVSNNDFQPRQTYIICEICCSDENDEDVEVPAVRYKFRDIKDLTADTWAVPVS